MKWCENCNQYSFALDGKCPCKVFQYRVEDYHVEDEWVSVYCRGDREEAAEAAAQQYFAEDPSDISGAIIRVKDSAGVEESFEIAMQTEPTFKARSLEKEE